MAQSQELGCTGQLAIGLAQGRIYGCPVTVIHNGQLLGINLFAFHRNNLIVKIYLVKFYLADIVLSNG